VNGRTIEFFYEPDTLRLGLVALPAKTPALAGPMIRYSYNDMALSTTALTFFGAPDHISVASRSLTLRDGRGSTREERNQAADGSSWDVVATDYDAMGRLNRQSVPYRLNPDGTVAGQVVWAKYTHDPLGRTTATEAPDTNGGVAISRTFFNE